MTEKGNPEVDLARRKLLKTAVYVAPVVMSVVVVNHASAQPSPSCGPATCQPSGGPCGPNSCKPRP